MITNIDKGARKIYFSIKAMELEEEKKAVKDYGSTQEEGATMFPKETRQQVARIISDRELEHIKQGEYDVPQGTVS